MSGFLLDINVISEVAAPKPNTNVIRRVEAADESILFLSVLTLGQIRRGIERLRV